MSGRRADAAPLRLVAAELGRAEGNQARHDELADLAAAAALGEPGAVRTFLVMVLPHAFKVVRRVLGARHPEVEDTVQESASNILKALPRYRGDASVRHFVCRVAVLTAMNVRRRHSAHKRTFLRDEEASIDAVPSLRGAPDAELVARESAEAVRELLDTLPLEQAEVLALHCVLGYTIPEIAATSSIPAETVRSRLRLSKQALRDRALHDPRLLDLVREST
jgi:RNA polymerase sigma factor (sigma-70 family)